MEKRALKIFLSCAFGAAIGTLVALKIYQCVWFLGPVVGGVIGYLSYEFKKVITAVKVAWHKVANYNWREDFKNEILLLVFTSMLFSSFLFVILMDFSMSYLELWTNIKDVEPDNSVLLVYILLRWIFFFSLSYFAPYLCFYKYYKEGNLKKMLLIFNPVTICTYWPIKSIIWVSKFVIKITPKVIKMIPGAIRVIWKGICVFLKTVFILIHSELRLLCGIDAAIGATIGYFSGYVFIGLIAGGILGMLNYEIVSKRLLKLVCSN